jgi:hypothetical protein
MTLGWITFAVAGIMQGALLVMCLFWKVRQRKLGIDDFGNPLVSLRLLLSTTVLCSYTTLRMPIPLLLPPPKIAQPRVYMLLRMTRRFPSRMVPHKARRCTKRWKRLLKKTCVACALQSMSARPCCVRSPGRTRARRAGWRDGLDADK